MVVFQQDANLYSIWAARNDKGRHSGASEKLHPLPQNTEPKAVVNSWRVCQTVLDLLTVSDRFIPHVKANDQSERRLCVAKLSSGCDKTHQYMDSLLKQLGWLALKLADKLIVQLNG